MVRATYRRADSARVFFLLDPPTESLWLTTVSLASAAANASAVEAPHLGHTILRRASAASGHDPPLL